MRKTQRTIAKPAELEGAGLFSGVPAKVKVSPAGPNAGVSFVRTDLPGRPRIPVGPETVTPKLRHSAVAGPVHAGAEAAVIARGRRSATALTETGRSAFP